MIVVVVGLVSIAILFTGRTVWQLMHSDGFESAVVALQSQVTALAFVVAALVITVLFLYR